MSALGKALIPTCRTPPIIAPMLPGTVITGYSRHQTDNNREMRNPFKGRAEASWIDRTHDRTAVGIERWHEIFRCRVYAKEGKLCAGRLGLGKRQNHREPRGRQWEDGLWREFDIHKVGTCTL